MCNEIPSYPTVLIGMTQAHNTLQDWESDSLILIGDVQAAKQVLAGGADWQLLDFALLVLAPADKVKLTTQKVLLSIESIN